ncbi:MAG TPA: prepilin peptidase [Edaphobacter sp.]|nr:prepilin peptidase [Edaphobacter sp.]
MRTHNQCASFSDLDLVMFRLTTEFVYPAAALLCAAIGAVYDVRSRRVPNLLTLPAILFGLLLHFTLGGWKELGSSLAGGLVCGFIFAMLYVTGGMGAGDVKLMTAVGCIAGLPRTGYLLILTALAGGAMALGLVLYRGRFKATISNIGALVVHHRYQGLVPHPELNVGNAQTLRLPYALAIAAGSALMFFALAVR